MDGPIALILVAGQDKLDIGQEESIRLALSRCSLRRAMFSLSVPQAQAIRKRLASFGHLSTVSRDGHISSSLSAWIYRCGPENLQDRVGSLGTSASSDERVASQLSLGVSQISEVLSSTFTSSIWRRTGVRARATVAHN